MIGFNVKWDNFTRIMTVFILLIFVALCVLLPPHTQSFGERVVLYLLPLLLCPCLFLAQSICKYVKCGS